MIVRTRGGSVVGCASRIANVQCYARSSQWTRLSISGYLHEGKSIAVETKQLVAAKELGQVHIGYFQANHGI